MEKIVEQGILYDFYGELLTDHQKKIYEALVYGDLSLSEIAQEQGISRQGVHDLIRRCDKILLDYEERLHLIRRFRGIRTKLIEIQELTKQDENDSDELMERIHDKAGQILEEL